MLSVVNISHFISFLLDVLFNPEPRASGTWKTGVLPVKSHGWMDGLVGGSICVEDSSEILPLMSHSVVSSERPFFLMKAFHVQVSTLKLTPAKTNLLGNCQFDDLGLGSKTSL